MEKIKKEMRQLFNSACEKICKAIIATNKPFLLTDGKNTQANICDIMYGYVFSFDDAYARELDIKGLLLKEGHLFVVLDSFQVHYTEDDLARLMNDIYLHDEVYEIYSGREVGSHQEILCYQTIVSIIESIDQYIDIE